VAATPTVTLPTALPVSVSSRGRTLPDAVHTAKLLARVTTMCHFGCAANAASDLAAWLNTFRPETGGIHGGLGLSGIPPSLTSATDVHHVQLSAVTPASSSLLADMMSLCTLYAELFVDPSPLAVVPHADNIVDFVRSHGRLCHLDRLVAVCIQLRCKDAVNAVLVS
jgi:hypothetical protein